MTTTLKISIKDVYFTLLLVIIFLPFVFIEPLYAFYKAFNLAHPFVMAFIKFGILSTIGESLGLRIKEGVYNKDGFGIAPRMIIWGILGVWIAMAMKLFAAGVPELVKILGINSAIINNLPDAFSSTLCSVVNAFFISLFMNTSFAPVFMTLHKITDMHIIKFNGNISCLCKPIDFVQSFKSINWQVQWSFVFKKTIPFFWIPAHTITFLLPASAQVLFAALLGLALGVILSIAARK